MKRWKFIRKTLASVGYTTIESVKDIVVDAMDEYNYVYYTDQNGDYVKATYNSTIPIVVNSETENIYFDGNVYLASRLGTSGWTYTYVVTNENGLDVTSEIRFTSGNENIVITGGTNGRVLTAVASGETTVSLYHEDWDEVTNPTASGETAVVVGQLNTNLFASAGTLDPTGTGAFEITASTAYYITTGVTIQNQLDEAVTVISANLYYSFMEATASQLTNDSVMNTAVTGNTTLVIYDYNAKLFNSAYTGVSYTVSVVE